MTRRLIEAFDGGPARRATAARQRLEVLTERECEVVTAVAEGLSNAEIGRRLGATEATVKSHVSRVLAKLGLTNRVQAAILVHDATLA